jgi:hypothetical protein
MQVGKLERTPQPAPTTYRRNYMRTFRLSGALVQQKREFAAAENAIDFNIVFGTVSIRYAAGP